MKAWPLILLAACAAPGPAQAGPGCAEFAYPSERCPWFGPADEGFAAPTVMMRLSADGYPPGSAAGRWNDGIYVIVRLPGAGPSGEPALWVDVGYEPAYRPHEARALDPVAVTLRLHGRDWRADAPEPQAPHGEPRFTHDGVSFHRFAFGADLVAAMLAASADGPASYAALMGENPPPGVLHLHIRFRDETGAPVASDELLDIKSGQCTDHCLPRLSLAGFAEAYAPGE